MTERSFTRYLAAKRSVDDRALDRRVWGALTDQLARRQRAAGPLSVLEVGAGSGAMVERLVGQGLVSAGRYLALDADPTVIADGRRRLVAWAAANSFTAVERDGVVGLSRSGSDDGTRGQGEAAGEVEVTLAVADLFDFLEGQTERYDLVVAHAVLDVVDLGAALAAFDAVLQPGGLFYLPITFDGASLFAPEIDPELDRRIETLYHRSMTARGGSSDTGRRLFGALRAIGAEVVAAGASDWIVHAGADGYPGDEAYFLEHILGFFEDELAKHLEVAEHPELDRDRFAGWLARRREQVADGSLVYIAHQLDVLARSATKASPPRSADTPVHRPT